MDERQYDGLMAYLVQLPDRRARRGRRYAWEYLLGCLASSYAGGARGPLAMHEWCADHFALLAEQFGPLARGVPSESTFQRLLQALGGPRLETLIEQHNRALLPPPAEPEPEREPEPVHLPVDGKVIREAHAHGAKHWLLGLASASERFVLRQVRVPSGTNEEGALPALLAGLDLRGCLLSFDAGFCSRPVAAAVLAAGGDYLIQAKRDCPELYAALRDWFATPGHEHEGDWAAAETRERGHGRDEWRHLEVSGALAEYLADWPGVQLVLKRTCQRTFRKSGEAKAAEVSYAICSLSAEAVSARWLLDTWRAHWQIENGVHHTRDQTLGEDRWKVWAGDGPEALSALGNALLAIIRQHDRWPSVASALRWASRNPIRAMQLVGLLPL